MFDEVLRNPCLSPMATTSQLDNLEESLKILEALTLDAYHSYSYELLEAGIMQSTAASQ